MTSFDREARRWPSYVSAVEQRQVFLLPSRARAQVRVLCADSVDAPPQTFTSVILTGAVRLGIMASPPRRSALFKKISRLLAA